MLTDYDIQRLRECDDAYVKLLGRALVADPKDYEGIVNSLNLRQSMDASQFEDWLKTTEEYKNKPVPKPPIPKPTRASLAEPIKANFCGKDTPWGTKNFDIFLPCYTAEQRLLLYQDKLADGLNTLVLSVEGDYHGLNPFDFTKDFDSLKNLILEVQAAGLNVILFMASGDTGSDEGIETYFGGLLRYLCAVPDLRIVPAFEPVVGGWSSNRLSDAMVTIGNYLQPGWELWVHLSPTRASGSSNPVESTDPWQGDEAGFFRSDGGQFVTGLLYQTEHGSALTNPPSHPNLPDYPNYPGYLGRLYEISIRALVGGRGWRKTRVCVFETIAYDYFNNNLSPDYAKEVVKQCKALGYTDFGNGI